MSGDTCDSLSEWVATRIKSHGSNEVASALLHHFIAIAHTKGFDLWQLVGLVRTVYAEHDRLAQNEKARHDSN